MAMMKVWQATSPPWSLASVAKNAVVALPKHTMFLNQDLLQTAILHCIPKNINVVRTSRGKSKEKGLQILYVRTWKLKRLLPDGLCMRNSHLAAEAILYLSSEWIPAPISLSSWISSPGSLTPSLSVCVKLFNFPRTHHMVIIWFKK